METRLKRPCWNCGAREAETLVMRQELCEPCGEMYWRLLTVRVAIDRAICEDIPGSERSTPPLTTEQLRQIALEVFGPPLEDVEPAPPDEGDERTRSAPDDEGPATST